MSTKIIVGDLVTWKNSRIMVVEEDMYGYMRCAWIDKGRLGREILPEAELIKVKLADTEAKLHWDHHNTSDMDEYDELQAALDRLRVTEAITKIRLSQESRSLP